MDRDTLEDLQQHPRYAPVRFLKRGAFGAVILAYDKMNGDLVALKFIKKEQAGGASLAMEVLIHMHLRHPRIIALHEVFRLNSPGGNIAFKVFTTRHHLVLVLEYASGGDLSSLVHSGRGMDEVACCWIFQQVMAALHYCHEMGVACRDIKLENVLLTSKDAALPIVKLADFGLAAACDGGTVQQQLRTPTTRCCLAHDGGTPGAKNDQLLDAEGRHGGKQSASTSSSHASSSEEIMIVGTPGFLAPEVLRTRGSQGKSYDPKAADVWSSGVLLYALLTGTLPFQRDQDQALGSGERVRAVLRRIMDVDYHRPRGTSAGCSDLLGSLLAEDPSRRLTAAQALAHPWCCQIEKAQAVLGANQQQLEASRAAPPDPQLVSEVKRLMEAFYM